jgi:hydroxymethylbilane synthase
LALVQTELVAERLRRAVPGLEVAAVVVSTRGDQLAEVPLGRLAGQGVFVKEVQAAVLEGRADAAVHSAKDLPPVVPDGLVVAAVPVRADVRDALVGCTLDGLPAGGTVATGSARRRAQLANLRPDLTFVELRGNMATRLDRVDGEGVDSVVVALAALERLGWSGRVAEVLSPLVCLPQIGQGALAIECRADDGVVRGYLGAIDDAATHRALDAERALLAALGAGCTMPVGGWARPAPSPSPAPGGPDGTGPPPVGPDGTGPPPGDGDGPPLVLEGMLASGDGRVVVRASATGPRPEALGRAVAAQLRDRCGAESIPGWARGAPEVP